MPDIMIRQANIAALATVRPFGETGSNWAFRRCPYQKGRYTIGLRSNGAAGGMDFEVAIGTTKVVQRSQASVGGTDGVIPTPDGTNSSPFHSFDADFNDEIDLVLFETGNVATTDIMIWASVQPLVP